MLLSDDDRVQIARGASTLFECLAAPADAAPANEADGPAVLAAWSRAFSPGDPGAFTRRLGWDGLEEAGVLRALATAGPSRSEPPAWTAWLDRFLDEAGPDAASPDDVWPALARCARRALAAQAGESHTALGSRALESFEDALIRDLAAHGDRALREHFRAGAPRGLAGFFTTHPVLSRHLAILVSTWVAATVELLSRLRRDRDTIQATFGVASLGEVCEAAPALSDRHAGGRAVASLTFTSGLRIVYKPRDVGLERALQQFQEWLAERGLPLPPPVRVLECEGYGWAERVDQAAFDDRAEVAEYFRRAGAAACLLHVLRAADAHQENVVATRGGPVLIDGEMLLQPVDAQEAGDARVDGFVDGAAHGIPRSCLSSGFVTLVEVEADGVANDIGGLMPGGPRPRAAPLRNDVVLHGVVQRPESFAGHILSGFSTAYRFFLERRALILAPGGPLALFAGRRSRILFRPSAHYGLFLEALRVPRYQRRGLDRSIALEMMNRVFAPEHTRPRLWPLVAGEREALEALDVPHYLLSVTESVVTAASGEAVTGHLARSGLDAVADGMHAMSEGDLARQLDLLASALEGDADPRVTVAPHLAAPTGLVSDGKALWMRGAEILGGRILERPGDGASFDLYRGQAGIALFLAALAAVTKDDRFRDAARDALRPLVARLGAHGPAAPATWPSVGACSGSGSVVYALATAGRLLDDGAAEEAAHRWARAIDPARIDAHPHYDVAGGTAGLLLALLALDDAKRPAWLGERIAACARRLVDAQVATANGGAWPGAGGRPLPGFAHGAAGIAYALARAYMVTGEASVAEAVRRAYEYERGVFSAAARNWPAVHDGGTVIMNAWCHGAPGIGLARALGLQAFRDAETEGEIAVAMAATRAAADGRADHLCCGVMGRSEALLVMGRQLGDTDAIAAAQEMATRIASAACRDGGRAIRTEGFEHRTFQPGFFRGLAGIGYQLLRTAEPARLPSVLGFERLAREAS